MTRRANAGGGLAEAQLQDQVEQLAGYYRWLVFHDGDSRRSHKGFPDLVLLRPPELLFVELKSESGRVRPEQRDWISALETVSAALDAHLAHTVNVPVLEAQVAGYGLPCVEAHIWRPADWDTIVARLSQPRRRTPEAVAA